MRTKFIFSGLIIFIMLMMDLTSFAQPNQNENKSGITVYYFHFNTRCETCRAVESEAKQDVKELFGNKVNFEAHNLDEPSGEAVGSKLGINSQCLVVVKGEKRVELTNEGFLYANTDPEKFKKIVEQKIKPLL